MSPVMGRPKAESPKNVQIKIRADQKTVDLLSYCCDKTGMTKSDVIRLGIEKVREMVDSEKK